MVNVKSDMYSFLQLVRPLHDVMVDPLASTTSMRFNPNLHLFQYPTRAMTNLSVDFGELPAMLQWMEIKDLQDHRSFGIKSSAQSSGSVLRILGTTCIISIETTASSKGRVDVDCVLPFVSCTESMISELKILLSEESNEPDTTPPPSIPHELQTKVVFYRHRENYDACQGRYLSPWRARHVTWSFYESNPDRATASQNKITSSTTTNEFDASFTIQWSRSTSLPCSTWTEDATFMGSFVMGQITVFFPSVVFFGPSTVSEIQALIDSHCS